MAKNYDRTDLYFTRRGDYLIGPDGDLFDTEEDPLRSVVQEIRSRLQSDKGDWVLYPKLGSDISYSIGEANNKQTAEELKVKVVASLNQYNLIEVRDINVSYVPIGAHTLLLRLRIAVSATDRNNASESVNIQIIYNYTDSNIHIL